MLTYGAQTVDPNKKKPIENIGSMQKSMKRNILIIKKKKNQVTRNKEENWNNEDKIHNKKVKIEICGTCSEIRE